MADHFAKDEQVMTLVATALKLDSKEREPFLRATCGSDERLYEEASEVLEWEARMGAFLRHPMIALRDADLPFEPGELIAERFEIIRKIGEGGMGFVYEAFDRKRKQRIAIKAAKPGFGRLLSPELEGCLKVRHPNVCLVNEIHSAPTVSGNIDFLTMELLEGETLSTYLGRKGKLAGEEAREIARQLCAGLEEAHRSGVIHRDIKAGNVILCRDANAGLRAVITDFGLSGEAAQSGFFGTQRYMAPELLLGQKASKATDIYALGVVLYEMVAGIQKEEATETAPAPRDALRPYRKLVADFLSLEPERRCCAFETATERLSPQRYSRRQLLGAGIGAACALAGGTGWLEWEHIENWLQPLPKKRFVALMAWPPDMDLHLKPLVSGAIDAIENELARAESADRDLLVIPARNVIDTRESGWLGKLAESLGVNLALQASGVQTSKEVGLLLKLLDVSTGTVLRQRQIVCPLELMSSLMAKAVRATAELLNVRWNEQDMSRLRPSTDSVIALQAFQTAEELAKKPNDDGLQEAIDSYKKAIETDPKYAAAYAKLGGAYCRLFARNEDLGVLDLAQLVAKKATELDQRNAEAHLALAMVFNRRGKPDEAQAEIRRAIRLDPTNPMNLYRKAQIYAHFQQWDEALQTYSRLQNERPNYWMVHNERGFVLTQIGRYREAIEAFRVAAAAAPRAWLAPSNLGALHFKLGNMAEAEENYRRSLAIKPNHLAFLNLAEVYRVKGNFGGAIKNCQKAQELAPFRDEPWLGLADCYEAMGGHQRQAHDAFQTATAKAERHLQTDQNDYPCWMRLALYRVKTRSSEEWRALLKKGEEHGLLDVDSEIVRARILELGGRRKDALETLASCFRRGATTFQIDTVADLKLIRKSPQYVQMLRSVLQSGGSSKPQK